jgi:16S rRNA (guanine527-N7)-methyltransferase
MSGAEDTLRAFVAAHVARLPHSGDASTSDELALAMTRLLRYREELLRWNERVNLTAIVESEEVLIKHFLDSLTILGVTAAPTCRLLDIGSGAGFPGLPLKIVCPSWSVVLLEATARKVAFLEHMQRVLELDDLQVIHGRAEQVGHQPAYRGAFDLVTARAVAALPVVLEYASPFCRPGGLVVLPRKGDTSAERGQAERAATALGLAFEAELPVTLPGLDDGRYLSTWRQIAPCPHRFPRQGAALLKRPAGDRG